MRQVATQAAKKAVATVSWQKKRHRDRSWREWCVRHHEGLEQLRLRRRALHSWSGLRKRNAWQSWQRMAKETAAHTQHQKEAEIHHRDAPRRCCSWVAEALTQWREYTRAALLHRVKQLVVKETAAANRLKGAFNGTQTRQTLTLVLTLTLTLKGAFNGKQARQTRQKRLADAEEFSAASVQASVRGRLSRQTVTAAVEKEVNDSSSGIIAGLKGRRARRGAAAALDPIVVASKKNASAARIQALIRAKEDRRRCRVYFLRREKAREEERVRQEEIDLVLADAIADVPGVQACFE